jgi:16S rRNA (uracil1498-N3)-methyltransferase
MQESHFKNIEFFYSKPENISGNIIIIDGDEFNHLIKVMRKKVDDIILAVDGLGAIYECKISEINRSNLAAEIVSKTKSHNEPNLDITLALGLLKNPSKYDFVVEKATELGVKRIIPFISKFTIAQKPKIERWQNLAISAMKQSQRAYLPLISECVYFKNILDFKADIKLIAEIDSDEIKLNSSENNIKEVIILIGPEGGFSDEEITSAVNAGFQKFKLSEMRLRAETAAVVSIPLIIEKYS